MNKITHRPRHRKMSVVHRVEKQRVVNRFNKAFFGLAVFVMVGLLLWHLTSLGKMLLVLRSGNSVINNGRTNLVVDYGDGVALVSIDNLANVADVFLMPGNLYVSDAATGTKYRFSAIYDVGKLENPENASKDFIATAQNVFGVPIDGFVKLNAPQTFSADNVQALRVRLFGYGTLFSEILTGGINRQVATNLSVADFAKLWIIGHGIRFDKVTVHDFARQNSLIAYTLPDDSKVLAASDPQVDRTLEGIVTDPIIVKENDTVEIVNASGVDGLGNNYARLLTNIGVHVIRVRTAENTSPTSQILLQKQSADELVKRLLKLRNFTIMSQNNSGGLGNVTVIIGEQ